MHKSLHIFDMSPFIYAGAVNKYFNFTGPVYRQSDGSFGQLILPSAGIRYLLTRISETLQQLDKKADIVICVDSDPTTKKNILPNYKSNRSHNEDIMLQKEMAEYIVRDIGFKVLKEYGYEADDLISSVVAQYKHLYDIVVVHTDDSDMYFNVDKNVMILSARRNNKFVTFKNYETITKCKWNTINAVKVLKGDASDNIPAETSELKDKLLDYIKTSEGAKIVSDRDLAINFFYRFNEDLGNKAFVVYPVQRLSVEVIPHEENDFNRGRFNNWLIESGGKAYSEERENIDDKVASLFSGSYSLL